MFNLLPGSGLGGSSNNLLAFDLYKILAYRIISLYANINDLTNTNNIQSSILRNILANVHDDTDTNTIYINILRNLLTNVHDDTNTNTIYINTLRNILANVHDDTDTSINDVILILSILSIRNNKKTINSISTKYTIQCIN